MNYLITLKDGGQIDLYPPLQDLLYHSQGELSTEGKITTTEKLCTLLNGQVQKAIKKYKAESETPIVIVEPALCPPVFEICAKTLVAAGIMQIPVIS